MSLDEKFVPIQNTVLNLVSCFFKTIARVFGYPENPGIPIVYENPSEEYSRDQYLYNLPEHKSFWPPIQRPETWFETIFGPIPKLEKVIQYPYESNQEGFYNFYVEHYKNIFFLPDWFSRFLQINLNFCFDLTDLEKCREELFVFLMIFSQLIILRIAMSWFLSINPFKFPWSLLLVAVDWAEEILQGAVPSVLGLNPTGTVFLSLIGVGADSLNHLVFTMPYLASEGEYTQVLLNFEVKEVVVFHNLPKLWSDYPIPNEIREFWYKERPEILDFMQKTYNDLDIQFLPDNIIQQLNDQNNLVLENSIVNDEFSTQLLSNEFLNNVNFLTHQLHNFF